MVMRLFIKSLHTFDFAIYNVVKNLKVLQHDQNHTSIYSYLFAILMNAKKWHCVNWGLCFQRAYADRQKQIEHSNWLYLKRLRAFYEIETNEPSKPMKGHIETKQ